LVMVRAHTGRRSTSMQDVIRDTAVLPRAGTGSFGLRGQRTLERRRDGFLRAEEAAKLTARSGMLAAVGLPGCRRSLRKKQNKKKKKKKKKQKKPRVEIISTGDEIVVCAG